MPPRAWPDREAGKPMARDTIHRLFSQSKPITAAAVMLLVERGEIDLCAPVETFLPGFKNQQVLTESGWSRPPVRPR